MPGAGITVDAFICGTQKRKTCIRTPGDPVGSAVTDANGNFSISIPSGALDGNLLLLQASVDGVKLRALVTPDRLKVIQGASGGAQGGAGDTTPLFVDPISDAAVQLLEPEGLENYSDAGIDAVIAAVDGATAASSFDGLTTRQAVDVAVATAGSDPTVQMVLQEQRMTPTPTATATTTPTPSCIGDCGGTGEVTVDDILKGVNIALGGAGVDTCPAFDPDHSGTVTVEDIVVGVNNAVHACVH